MRTSLSAGRPRRSACAMAILVAAATPAAALPSPELAEEAAAVQTIVPMTRLSVGPCIVSDPLAGRQGFLGTLAGIFVPKLIGAGLDAFGRALRQAGEADTTPSTVSRALEFPLPPGSNCLHYVSGDFAVEVMPDGSVRLGATALTVTLPGLTLVQAGRLPATIAGLTRTPDLFVELRMRPSSDGSAMLVEPTYLSYGKGLKAKAGAERGLALHVAFHPPGKLATDSGATGAQLVFGKMKVGSHRFFPGLDTQSGSLDVTTAWFPVTFSPVMAGAAEREERASASFVPVTASAAAVPNPAASLPGESGGRPKPMNVTLTLTETRAPRKLLLTLAGVFDKSKGELQTEIEKLVLQQKREAAELEAATAQTTLQTDYEAAFVLASTHLIDLCAVAGSDDAAAKRRLEKSRDFNAAALRANLKAQALGKTAPFPALGAPSAARPSTCPTV